MGLWLALSGKVKTWLAVAGGVVIALFYAYIKGRTDQSKADEGQEISDYVETRRRLDDTTIPRDADAALDWLRKRQSGGDM
jgi:dienelactone hydrolase